MSKNENEKIFIIKIVNMLKRHIKCLKAIHRKLNLIFIQTEGNINEKIFEQKLEYLTEFYLIGILKLIDFFIEVNLFSIY